MANCAPPHLKNRTTHASLSPACSVPLLRRFACPLRPQDHRYRRLTPGAHTNSSVPDRPRRCSRRRKAAPKPASSIGERIMPTVGPLVARRRADSPASIGHRAYLARSVAGQRSRPASSSASDHAGRRHPLVVSAPIRREAFGVQFCRRRTSQVKATVIKKRAAGRRAACLGVGGVLGATAAWLAQAGKPFSSPVPLKTDDMSDTELHAMNGSHPLDLTPISRAPPRLTRAA